MALAGTVSEMIEQDHEAEMQRMEQLRRCSSPRNRHRLPPSIGALTDARQDSRSSAGRQCSDAAATAVSNAYYPFVVVEREGISPSVREGERQATADDDDHDGGDVQEDAQEIEDVEEMVLRFEQPCRRSARRNTWLGFRSVFQGNEPVRVNVSQELLRSREGAEEEGEEGEGEMTTSKRKPSRRLTETLQGFGRTVRRKVSAAFASRRKDSVIPMDQWMARVDAHPKDNQRDDVLRRQSLANRVVNYPYPSARSRYAERERLPSAPETVDGSWTPCENAVPTGRRFHGEVTEELTDSEIRGIRDAMDLPRLTRQMLDCRREMDQIHKLMKYVASADQGVTPPNLDVAGTPSERRMYEEKLVEHVKKAQTKGCFHASAVSQRFRECDGTTTDAAAQKRASMLWHHSVRDRQRRAAKRYRQQIFHEPESSKATHRGGGSQRARNLSEPAPTTASMTREERHPWKWLDALAAGSEESCQALAGIHSL